jgi:tRNA (mo5U34)-methyltransferase
MNLNKIREERDKWFNWKNIIPMRKAVKNLTKINNQNLKITFGDCVTITKDGDFSNEELEYITLQAKTLIPWRKGPFQIGSLKIDSEWQSNIKYNLLEPYFDLKDKIVADVGCNNGYYMFRMLTHKPKKLVGFDPSAIFRTQFDFINYFVQSDIKYELLGVEHLEFYEHRFDFIFMLGVLYHRSDPIASLKSLYRALNKNGTIIVDSFIIDGEDEVSLTPAKRYAMIPNVYFIPTINCFKNWLSRAGFVDIELLCVTKTNQTEQRATTWTFEQSLDNFLDPNDKSKTIEGYPAPKRAYLKAKRVK